SACGVFWVRPFGGLGAGGPLDPVLLGFHVLVVLVLGFTSLPLCRKCPVSLRKLRVTELVVFGLPAAFFLLLQRRVTLDQVARGSMPPPMPFWLLLIFTYAMFIPNTWRRAACVIRAMALATDRHILSLVLGFPASARAPSLAKDFRHAM